MTGNLLMKLIEIFGDITFGELCGKLQKKEKATSDCESLAANNKTFDDLLFDYILTHDLEK